MSPKETVPPISAGQMERVRIVSDSELYPEAVRFVAGQKRLPRAAQIAGLLQFSQDWPEWFKFVKHQYDRKTHGDIDFYTALNKWNLEFPKRVKDWKLSDVTEGSAAKRIVDHLCSLLVAEFAQHLAAECGYQRFLRKEKNG
jgi:hypothetical protein